MAQQDKSSDLDIEQEQDNDQSKSYKPLIIGLFTVLIIDLKRDLRLFISRDQLLKRNRYWQSRITRYALDATPETNSDSTSTNIYGTRRIDFTSHLLGVLDSKFSTLLQFLSLFGLMIGVWNKSDTDSDGHTLSILSLVFWSVWVLAALICFRGAFRVAWNEPVSVNSLDPDQWTVERSELKEEVEFKKLVDSLVRRTAWFRVAAVQISLVAILGVILIGFDLSNLDKYFESTSSSTAQANNPMEQHRMELLFSYGTLQQKNVQLTTFKRELLGSADSLPGYVVEAIIIDDPKVILQSGKNVHPILRYTGDAKDEVDGTLFEITAQELEQADEYEVDDYQRVSAVLKSGKTGWIYAAKDQATDEQAVNKTSE